MIYAFVIRAGFLRNPSACASNQPKRLFLRIKSKLLFVVIIVCDSGGIRTRAPQLRRLLLYPTELPNLAEKIRLSEKNAQRYCFFFEYANFERFFLKIPIISLYYIYKE